MMDLKREIYYPPTLSDFPNKDKSSRKDAALPFSVEGLFLLKDEERYTEAFIRQSFKNDLPFLIFCSLRADVIRGAYGVAGPKPWHCLFQFNPIAVS
jgi:hypothetical protein